MDSKLMSTKEFIDVIMDYVRNEDWDKVDCEFDIVPSVGASIDRRLINIEAIDDLDIEQGYGMRCIDSEISDGMDVIITFGAYGHPLTLVHQLTTDHNNDYDGFYEDFVRSMQCAFEYSRDKSAEDRDFWSLLLRVSFLNEQKGEN